MGVERKVFGADGCRECRYAVRYLATPTPAPPQKGERN